MRKRCRSPAGPGLCALPLAPAHAHGAHGGNGVTAAPTDHPPVDVERDSARRPGPGVQPENLAERGGLGRRSDLLGVRQNLPDGGAITVRVSRSGACFIT